MSHLQRIHTEIQDLDTAELDLVGGGEAGYGSECEGEITVICHTDQNGVVHCRSVCNG